jgi:hypothetical protein
MEAKRAQPVVAQNGSARGSQERPVVLRPGSVLPIMGYAAGYIFTIVAVILALVAHGGGKGGGLPPSGDWSAIGDRLIAGEVTAVFAWGFFKLGSQRIILADNTMRIITWYLTWTVGRNEVADVALSRQALTIVLIDGSTIEPAMFWSSGPGMVYLRAGFFRNAMSREKIRDKILQWREPTDPKTVERGLAQSLGQWRISRVRANLPLLVGLVAFVAAEAVIATAFL